MTKDFWVHLAAQVGGAVVTTATATLGHVDFSSLGVFATLAQSVAAMAAEFGLQLAQKWNPPAPTGK